MPQDPSRKSIANQDEPDHKYCDLQLVRGKIRHRISTVADGKITHAKIAK